jgi:hypothetical protein
MQRLGLVDVSFWFKLRVLWFVALSANLEALPVLDEQIELEPLPTLVAQRNRKLA